MANIVFNVAKGRVVEYYNRVKGNDPAASRLILVPIETSGLEDAATVLIDSLTLAEVLDGATNEQTSMGRKVLTDAELAAFPAPDLANNRYDVSLPTVTWTSASGNAIAKIAVCYDATSAGADSAIIPLTMFDAAVTPDGTDIQLTSGVFFRAS